MYKICVGVYKKNNKYAIDHKVKEVEAITEMKCGTEPTAHLRGYTSIYMKEDIQSFEVAKAIVKLLLSNGINSYVKRVQHKK